MTQGLPSLIDGFHLETERRSGFGSYLNSRRTGSHQGALIVLCVET